MKKIKITLGKSSEFNTDISVKGIHYHVQTEEGTEKNPFVITRAYLGGTVADMLKSPYPSEGHTDETTLKDLMVKQHKEMIEKLKEKHIEHKKTRNEYVKEVRKLISRKKIMDAQVLIEDAVLVYPEDAFLMSYHGYLMAAATKKYKEGIEMCKNALTLYKEKVPGANEFYYHVFYLNLGLAYMSYGKKDFAVKYLEKGLQYDLDNKDIMKALINLGIRKRPVIPLLPRSHFINKYLGKALVKMGLR